MPSKLVFDTRHQVLSRAPFRVSLGQEKRKKERREEEKKKKRASKYPDGGTLQAECFCLFSVWGGKKTLKMQKF